MKDLKMVEYKKWNGLTGVMTVNDEPTMTQQQFKDECDINNIMRKYQTTGEITHIAKKIGMYGDFSEIPDYHQMHQTVIEAEAAFMGLPAELRLRFKNDPGQLIDFLKDENNYEEGVKLGLLNKKPEAPIQNDLNETKIASKNKTKKPSEDAPVTSEA